MEKGASFSGGVPPARRRELCSLEKHDQVDGKTRESNGEKQSQTNGYRRRMDVHKGSRRTGLIIYGFIHHRFRCVLINRHVGFSAKSGHRRMTTAFPVWAKKQQ
jgi:hypothetical protein